MDWLPSDSAIQQGLEMKINERIRELAMGTCWTVADLDTAWKHMREIPNMSFDRFALFAMDCQRLTVHHIVMMAQAVQRSVTGEVMMRTGD